MLTLRILGVLFCFAIACLAVVAAAPADQEQTEPKSAADPAAPAPTEPASEKTFPLIVRIDKSALIEASQKSIARVKPVDRAVLGTRALGQSRIVGTVDVDLVPDSIDASFDLCFQGKIAARTVGTQGPAVIHSRTFTDFTCKQRIEFDPHHGFLAVGRPKIESDTQLVYDGFGANRRLGRRLIALVAERRARQSSGQARQIVDRKNREELEKGFTEAVARQIVVANERTDVVRYVNRFLGEQTTLQITAKSAEDCIHIGIGPAEEKYAPITAMPVRDERPARIEVWVHSSILGEPIAAILGLANPQQSLPALVQRQILGALSPASAEAGSATGVGRTGTWLIFGVADDTPAPEIVPAEVARRP